MMPPATFSTSKLPPPEQFRPDTILGEIQLSKPEWLLAEFGTLAERDIADLKALNHQWIGQPMGMKEAVAAVMLINQEFTRRGIAPAWRGLPPAVRTARGDGWRRSTDGSVTLLGNAERRRVLMRWLDMLWLREELGQGHTTAYTTWNAVFSADEAAAARAIHSITAPRWRSSELKAQKTGWVLDTLKVPALHRIGLCGLRHRDQRQRHDQVRKRVDTVMRPRLEALMDDPRQRLKQSHIERRLLMAEAIELSWGRPADSSRLFRWMSGQGITPQTMHEMRNKLASQLALRGKAWVGQR